MARLIQIGFELNSITAGVEFDSVSGAPTIQTSTVHGGTYAMQVNASAASIFSTYQYAGASNTNNTYVRAYFNFQSFPTANSISIMLIRDSVNGNNLDLRMNSNGTFLVTNEQNASAQVGNTSPAITLNKWYRVELAYTFATGATRAYLALGDGPSTLFAQGTATASIGSNTLRWGTIDAATANFFIDDISINDQTGTNQTDIPGPEKIVHLRPNATGDSNGFSVNVGGTAGAANNFTRVNEVTPDDATSYNGAALLNAEDLFNMDNFAGGAFASINVVAVGIRCADLVSADASLGVKLELMKTSGGMKSQSANIIPNSTAFITNSSAAPHNYPLVTYQNPDSTPWTQPYLDSIQAGYIEDTTGVQTMAVSTTWVSVAYVPVLYGTTTSTSSTSISSTSSSISSTSSSTSSTSSSTSSTSTSISTSSTSTSLSITTNSTSSTSSSTSSTSTSSTSTSTSISSTSSSISSTSISSTSTSSTSSSTSISSTSTSFSSTSSSISSTSSSVSSTSFSSTSSSSSTSTTTLPPPNLDYTFEDRATYTVTRTFGVTDPTIWVAPAYVTSVLVECWGAGGSGSSTNGTSNVGGGGGAYARLNALSVTPGTSYSLSVGVGGLGLAPTNATGNTGGDTWFSSSATVLAKGGTGGIQTGAGTGGDAGSSIGDITFSGGNAGAGNASQGSAGGGSAGSLEAGSNGGTGATGTGGGGGAVLSGIGGIHGAGGNSPGAGGGGGNAENSGAGAGGMVRLTYTVQGLPTNAVDRASSFNTTQYSNVNADDGDYFIEKGTQYLIREYKNKHQNNTDAITFTWKGRSTVSTIVSPILMQIYNVNSLAWETLAVQNQIAADTDFTVTVTQSTNLSNYYDTTNTVTFRSYQLVV